MDNNKIDNDINVIFIQEYMFIPHPNLSISVENFNGTFLNHQLKGISWMLKREDKMDDFKRGGILADDMGLGKTIQMIGTILGSSNSGPTILITPVSLINQWYDEIRKWAPDLKVIIIYGKNKKESLKKLAGKGIEQYNIVITSYGLVTERKKENMIYNFLKNISWLRMILDEGHVIRNSKTRLHKSVIEITADIKWILTGTPIHNSIKDGKNILNMIGVEGKRFSIEKLQRMFHIYLLRRTKQILKKKYKLNKPTVYITPVELKGEERTLYKNQHERTVHLLKMFSFILNNSLEMLSWLSKMRQVSIHPQLLQNHYHKSYNKYKTEWINEQSKFDKLMELIKSHPNDSALVFCYYHEEIDMLEKQFTDKNISVLKYDGRCSNDTKKQILSRCSSLDYKKYIQLLSVSLNKNLYLSTDIQQKIYNYCKVDVLIMQINSGSVGLNLQKFNHIYFTSPHYNPAIEDQAIGRCYRFGQKKPITVHKLISVLPKDDNIRTLEQNILDIQQRKRITQAEILEDNALCDNGTYNISKDDIKYMLGL